MWLVPNVGVPLVVVAIVLLVAVRAAREWRAAYATLAGGNPAAQALALPLRAARVRGGWAGAGVALGGAFVVFVVVVCITTAVFVARNDAATWTWGEDSVLGILLLSVLFTWVGTPIGTAACLIGLVTIGALLGAHVAGTRCLAHYDAIGDDVVTAVRARLGSTPTRGIVAGLIIVGIGVTVLLGVVTAIVAWAVAAFALVPSPPGSKTM